MAGKNINCKNFNFVKMSDTVIRVENLGKKYIISHQKQERYTALRDVITNKVKSVGSLINPQAKKEDVGFEEFWALKDVSFNIKQGDRVGIIGRNGAGKSTLLKILSRITEPTTGRIKIKGRVVSLLEVGTGFHPELTGRENIFLNGAILGMGKEEIKRKFDEIVAFAEVEKFLDTPVKRYSSGMYVRLAFAVAAHLEPEILIVDEVLAVGDAQFQKKCLGKMEDVGKEGRTVLFVSHQMAAIEKLCSRALLLRQGQIKFTGESKETINYYLQDVEVEVEKSNVAELKRSGTGDVKIIAFSVEDSHGNSLSSVASGENIVLVFHYETLSGRPIKNLSLGFSIHSSLGETISILYSDYQGYYFSEVPQLGKIKCKIQNFPYSLGRYLIGVRVLINGVEADWPKGYVGFIDVEAGDFFGTGSVPHSAIGPVLIRGNWDIADNSQKSVLSKLN
jgi:lipopolysaccharide transport system ATP-binding protein